MAVKMEMEVTTLPAQEREPQETIDSSSRGDIPLRWFTTLLMLVFPTAVLFVNRADSYIFWLLVLIGIWVWMRHGARPFLDRWSGALLLTFALFFGITILAYLCGLQTQDGFRFLGRYARFLFIAPVFLAFRRYPPTAKTVFIGLASGALVGGLGSVWYFLQVRRINGMEAATDLHIIFGDLATTMVLCTVAGFGLMAVSRRAWSLPVLYLSVAGGVAASIISGARGAWIALLLLPLLLLMPLNSLLKRRHVFAVVLVLVAVCALFYLVAGRATQERVKGIVSELDNYSVSLHYLALENRSPLNHPVCMPKLEFLEAWAHAGYGVEGAPRITVVSDPIVGDTSQCKLDYAVQIHNFSQNQNAQYIFPRYAANLGADHKTVLMARGAGGLSFTYESTMTAMISSVGYERAVLVAYGGLGNEINVYIAPGKTIWVVPLESYIGEFGMSVADNSVGNRIEMWRAAWMLFLSHPLLGVGTGAYQPSTDRLIAEGKIMPTIASYDHPHNDYFNALASAGIVGLLALLGVLLLPACYFRRAAQSRERDVHTLGLAGVFTVASFAIYALTDVIFLHNMMIIWYVVYVALLFALIQNQLENQKGGSV